MAERTIREFSTPSNTNVPTGPTTMVGDGNFKLKTTLLNMVQENLFSDKPMKMPMHISSTFWRCVGLSLSMELQMMPSVFLFPFSLLRKAKLWFYAERDAISTRD
jgi:hypothetical protein